MAVELINVGTVPDDDTGDTYRASFTKVNAFEHYFVDSAGGAHYGVLVGLLNSYNMEYAVSKGNYVSGSIMAFYNRLPQDITETTPGSGIFTFSFAPDNGDSIFITYRYTL